MRLQGYGRRDFVEILDKTLEKLGSKKGAALVKTLLDLPDEQWKSIVESAIEVVESRHWGNRDPLAHTRILELRLQEGLTRAEMCARISTPAHEIGTHSLHHIEYPTRKGILPGHGAPIVEAVTKRFKRSWEDLTQPIRTRADAE